MGLFKKVKKGVKKVAKKVASVPKRGVKEVLREGKDIYKFTKTALTDVVGEFADIVSPLTSSLVPDIPEQEILEDIMPDPNKPITDAVDREQRRAQKYAAYSTEAATNKKRKLGNYGDTEISKYIDKLNQTA